MADDASEKVKELEREKERQIGEYMSLQDRADEINERIYRVCCGIEALNGQIEMAREEARKAEEKARRMGTPPSNGKHHPPTA